MLSSLMRSLSSNLRLEETTRNKVLSNWTLKLEGVAPQRPSLFSREDRSPHKISSFLPLPGNLMRDGGCLKPLRITLLSYQVQMTYSLLLACNQESTQLKCLIELTQGQFEITVSFSMNALGYYQLGPSQLYSNEWITLSTFNKFSRLIRIESTVNV